MGLDFRFVKTYTMPSISCNSSEGMREIQDSRPDRKHFALVQSRELNLLRQV